MAALPPNIYLGGSGQIFSGKNWRQFGALSPDGEIAAKTKNNHNLPALLGSALNIGYRHVTVQYSDIGLIND